MQCGHLPDVIASHPFTGNVGAAKHLERALFEGVKILFVVEILHEHRGLKDGVRLHRTLLQIIARVCVAVDVLGALINLVELIDPDHRHQAEVIKISALARVNHVTRHFVGLCDVSFRRTDEIIHSPHELGAAARDGHLNPF